ncbi:hypothetical protein [Dinoroseobacter sp. S124A]|uniref:hypothetical protein n=1 Tax=Dinoroseobacter sp. S124A TaxID=3415128 RepID=UPI003C7BC66E
MKLRKWKIEVIPHDCDPFTVHCFDYVIEERVLSVLIEATPCKRKHFPLANIYEITATEAEI